MQLSHIIFAIAMARVPQAMLLQLLAPRRGVTCGACSLSGACDAGHAEEDAADNEGGLDDKTLIETMKRMQASGIWLSTRVVFHVSCGV